MIKSARGETLLVRSASELPHWLVTAKDHDSFNSFVIDFIPTRFSRPFPIPQEGQVTLAVSSRSKQVIL